MSVNLKEFALAVDAFAKKDVPQLVEQFTRRVALQLLDDIVHPWPVDTGHSRANWQVTLDTPATGVVEGVDKDGGATIAKGAAVIGQLKAYGKVWLSNNLPYSVRLEQGWSQQAPAGVVGIAVDRLRATFK